MEDFIAGGLASTMAITIMHPVDVVKSRLQFAGEMGSASKNGNGVFRSLVQIAKLEGLSGLYRGLLPAYALQFAVTSTRFGVYGIAKKVMAEYDDENVSEAQKASRNFVLAAVSGACGGVLGAPFFALKTRAQVFSSSKELAVGTQHNERALEAFVNIYKNEGLKGYTRGMNAFVPRVVFFGAAQLGVYDMVKPFLKDRLGLKEGVPLHFSSAFIAAVSAVVAIQPFDFLAARLMNQPTDPVTKRGLLYDGFFDCARKSIQNEGLSCLLKGGWANMVRMGPYSVLVLMFFEQTKRLVSSH